MHKSQKLALFLVICMLSSLFGVFPASQAEAVTLTEISNVEPAILANVGTTVNLSNYSVQLNDGTVLNPAEITWYNGSTVISSFTPTSKGVTTLTAKKTSAPTVSKTVYIVAKLSSETEYVLFFTDFNSASDIDGWNKTSSTAGVYTVSGGKLTINGLLAGNPRIYLPEWLSDFGNYRIDTVATQAEATDSSRWFSVIYRAKNVTGAGTPYYHMCMRNNMALPGTATTGGVECVSYTTTWNYYKSAGYTEAVNSSKNYTFSVLAKDNVVQYQIDNNKVLHVDDLPAIAPSINGGIGLQGNSSKFIIDSIKVTIQETSPEPPPPPAVQLFNVRQPDSNTRNHVTNIGLINSAQEFNSIVSETTDAPATLIFYADGSSLKTKDGSAVCSLSELMEHLDKDIFIPAFHVSDTATVDTIINALKAASICDALFISKNPDIVKYARQSYTMVRGAVDFTDMDDESSLSAEALLFIRGNVNKALALTAILPAKYAVKEYVEELQSNAITVWVMEDDLNGDTEAARLITSGANGIITNDFAAIEDALTELFVPFTMTRTPLIIGHRGNPSQAPENSISGYLKAIENGADVVETDIMLSKDGKVVIMHDSTIDRTTNGTGTVSNMTLEQLKEFHLWGPNNMFKDDYPDEKIPTLEEMLQAIKPTNGKIFIEIKTGNQNIVQPMVDLINQYDMESRVTVICFDANQLRKTQQLMPEMSTGYLLNGIDSATNINDALVTMYKQLEFIQPANSTLNVNASNQSIYFVKVAGDRGVTIWPWTYSNSWPSVFNSHYLLGIDGLTTDDAQYAKNMVKNIYANNNTILLKDNGSVNSYSLSSVTYGEDITNITSDSKTFVKILEGEDLITVNNGVITATASEGYASFMLGYSTKTTAGSDYVLYTQPITVVIGVDDDGLVLNQGSNYELGEYLTGVTDNTTLEELLSNFESANNIVVLNKNGEQITSDTAVVGTGCRIQYYHGEFVLEEKIIVVYGDLDGDGKIRAQDYLMVKRAFLGSMSPTQAQLKAACLSGSDQIKASDYLKIKRHFLGTINIFDL